MKRLISFLLALLMLISILPLSVLAAENNGHEKGLDSSIETTSEPSRFDLSSSLIISEDETKRERSVKHFVLENGTYLAVEYAFPIHKLDENGKWIELKNEFEEADKENSSTDRIQKYDADLFYAEIRETGSDINTVIKSSNSTGEIGIVFKTDDPEIEETKEADEAEEKPKAEETNEELEEKDKTIFEKNMELIEACIKPATLNYRISGKSNMEIIASNTSIVHKAIFENKEDISQNKIIIGYNDKNTVENKDGSIDFIEADVEETKAYTLLAPSVYDAEGNYDETASYIINNDENGDLIISVKIDEEWLNEETRAFPINSEYSVVVVNDEPALSFSEVRKVKVEESSKNKSAIVLANTEDSTNEVLVSIDSIPNLCESDIILTSEMVVSGRMSRRIDETVNDNIKFFYTNTKWDENVCWETKPEKDIAVDHNVIEVENDETTCDRIVVDTSKIVREIVYGDNNYGIIIAVEKGIEGSALLYTSLSRSELCPYILVNYLSASESGNGETPEADVEIEDSGDGKEDIGEAEKIKEGSDSTDFESKSMIEKESSGATGNRGSVVDPIEGGNYTFEELTNFTKEYHSGGSWHPITNVANASYTTDGVKLRTNHTPYSFYYRAKHDGVWESFVSSNDTGVYDYAGLYGHQISNLEIHVYEGVERIFENYIVMFRAKVAGEWLGWVSNGCAQDMIVIKAQFSLDGELDTVSTEAGWESRGNIQALQIRMFKRVGYTGSGGSSSGSGQTGPGAFQGATNIGKTYRKTSTNVWTNFSSNSTANCTNGIDGVKLQTSGKPYYLYYRVKDAAHGWLSYVDSRTTTGNDSFAGWNGYPIYNLEIKVRDTSGTNLYDNYVVMYRAKVAGTWLDWVSNGSAAIMQEIKAQVGLSGNLDTVATDAGDARYGYIQALEIRVYERVVSDDPVGSYKIIDAPYINQYSVGMPNGCEPVSAVMALQYMGVVIDSVNFVDNFLPMEPVINPGNIHSDPNLVYVGDPRRTGGYGWGCYAPVIKNAARSCINSSNTQFANPSDKNFSVTKLSNTSLSSLCSNYINNNVPVILWATVDMTNQCTYTDWNTSSDQLIHYNNKQHCLLLVGYDQYYYYFNDPMRNGNNGHKYVRYLKSAVDVAYDIMGKQAVVITNNRTTGVGTANCPGYPTCQTAPSGSNNNPNSIIHPDPVETSKNKSISVEKVQDPIDLSTGSHVITHNLMTIFGAQNIGLDINYSSDDFVNTSLGYGWHHNFEKNLCYDELGLDHRLWVYDGGCYSVYTMNSDNTYTSETPTQQYCKAIEVQPDIFEITRRDGTVERYENNFIGGNNRLSKITYKNGQSVSITYLNPNVTKITDDLSGRYIIITKNNDYRITSVSDNSGRSATLGYTNGYLTSITDVNGNTIYYEYTDNGQIYRGMDGNGTIFFTDTYDANGRIINQKDAIAGHESSTLTYTNVYSTQNPDVVEYTLVTLIDRNQQTSVYKYNDKKQLVELTDPNNITTTYAYNASGDLVEVTNALGNSNRRVYDANGNLTEAYDALNNKTEYSYDSNNNLTQIKYPNNSIVTNTYNGNLLASTTDLRGVTTYYEYNPSNLLSRATCSGRITEYEYTSGQISKITDPLGRETTNTYNTRGFLVSTTDAKGNTTYYGYDNLGNVTSITDAFDNTSTIVYDCNGNIISSTDFAGNTTTYTYDGNLNKTSATLPSGGTVYYSYDGEDRLLSTTYPDGKSMTNTYDAGGRVISSSDKENGVTTYEYNLANQVVKTTNPIGGETTFTYNANGQKTKSTVKVEDNDEYMYYYDEDPIYALHETSYDYDVMGRLVKETNPAGGETNYTYNNAGDVITVADPLNNTTTNSYDLYGNLVSKTDPKGNVTTYAYDIIGNLISVTNALNQTTTYTYDNNNNLLSCADPCGHTVSYTYDALDRQIAVTDAKGRTTHKDYDALGNVVQIRDSSNHVDYAATYDAMGRVTLSTDSAGNSTSYTYDFDGNMLSQTNALGQTSYYTYDGMGRMLSSTDRAGSVSTAVYDAAGNATLITGPTGVTQKYIYDCQGRTFRSKFISEIYDGELEDEYEDIRYDSLGNVSIHTDFYQMWKEYSSDIAGRTTSSLGSSITYDANGNIVSEHNYSGTVTRVYDALNRVISYTDVNHQTIEYEYDACGNLHRMKYPTGDYAVYEYDANHNMISSGIEGSDLVTTYTYNARNQITRINRIDGSICFKIYDSAGRLTNSVDVDRIGHAIAIYNYTYNALGKLLTETDVKNSIKYTMEYDSLGRLTRRYGCELYGTTVIEEETYTYDAAGNILTATSLDGTTTTYTYGMNNEILSVDGNQFFGLDYRLRTDRIPGAHFNESGSITYDSYDRIKKVNGDYNEYWYDADGNRADMFYYSTNMMYTWDSSDGRNRLVWTKDHLLNTTIYGYGPDGLAWSLCDGNYKVYHYDYRGSVVAITDGSGSITNTYKYDAYGRVVEKTGSGKSIFGFNGQYGVLTDPNGMLYMRARFYSPEYRRFTTADVLKGSIADSTSLNFFTFVNGDPINYVDPMGTDRSPANRAPYGTITINGVTYPIAQPDTIEDPGWSIVNTYPGNVPDFDWASFLASFGMDGYNSYSIQHVENGSNRVITISNGEVNGTGNTIKLGISSLFIGVMGSVANNFNNIYADVEIQQKDGIYRAAIKVGSTKVEEMWARYAGKTTSMIDSAIGGVGAWTQISNYVSRAYESVTGNRASNGYYDLVVTVDKKHLENTYASYLWIYDGTLMESPIIYKDDKVAIYRREDYIIPGSGEEVYRASLGGAYPAAPEYQKALEDAIANAKGK